MWVVWTVLLVASLVAVKALDRASAGGGVVADVGANGVHRDQSDALARYGFALEEVARRSGVDFTHVAPIFDARLDHIMPQVASMGAAVAVADFDRDGWQDFYVTNSAEGGSEPLVPESGRRDVQERRAGHGRRRGESHRHRRVDGRDLGRLRQRRIRGSVRLQIRPPGAVSQRAGPLVHARDRARRPAGVGEREQRGLARLRPRRQARLVPGRATGPRMSISGISRRRGSCPRASSTRTTAAASTCSTTAATARSRTRPRRSASIPAAGRWPWARPICSARASRICSSRTITAFRRSTPIGTANGSSMSAPRPTSAARRRAG